MRDHSSRTIPRTLFLLVLLTTPCFPQGVITTIAGTDAVFPTINLPALTPLGPVSGVAADATGQVFLSLSHANVVLRLAPDGQLSLYAGNGLRGFSGDGGRAIQAMLNGPTALEVDSAGNLYIADTENNRVRKVSPQGFISTVAGGGLLPGDGGPATGVELSSPRDVALDAAGNLFIAGFNRIRKVTPNGIITTVAGGGSQPGDGIPATQAALRPWSVAVDGSGNLFIAETVDHRVRKINTAGIISTVAGTGRCEHSPDGGLAARTSLCLPTYVELDGGGNLLIADAESGRVRKVNPDGTITTLVGMGQGGFNGDGGPAIRARLALPQQLSQDRSGSLYIADQENHRLRKVTPDGMIRTVAGNGARFRFGGDGGPARGALLSTPIAVAVDPAGSVFIADQKNFCVRKVSPDGIIRSVAGNGQLGHSGDGGQATEASLNTPSGLALDSAGNLFVADGSHIHKVSPNGIITTIAGSDSPGLPGDGGPASKASFVYAFGVAVDSGGNLYIADPDSHRVRKVGRDGIINTIAGTGEPGFSGDGGPATQAQLRRPFGVAVDAAGNLYIADANNLRIRRVSANGIITTVAGNGREGLYSGEGGPATQATLSVTSGVGLDSAGNLYIADTGGQAVRRVGRDGRISTVAGSGVRGFFGDGGPATAAWLKTPFGVAVDPAGNVFIADTDNDRIRVVSVSAHGFTVSPASLAERTLSGGPPVPAGVVNLIPSIPGLPFSTHVSTRDGTNWLSVEPDQGSMPAALHLVVNPARLAPGTYEGTLTITCPPASPASRTVLLTLTVTEARPPQLSLETRSLSFSFGQAASPSSAQLTVTNLGSGSLAFTASASTAGGGGWLSVTPASGTASASSPAVLTVTATPGTLASGTYSGTITVTPASGPALTVAVTMTITEGKPRILLSQTGLTFTAVAGGGAPSPQSFAILNSGEGAMSWSAKAITLSGGDWLAIGSGSGSVAQPLLDVSMVDVSVNPSGLASGVYYGRIEVTAAAGNSPQTLTVILRVLAQGENPGPEVRPVGLVFIAAQGRSSPGSQDIRITNLASKPATYISSLATFGGNWVTYRPASATASPGTPSRMLVQPDFTSLASGVYRGVITLLFDDSSAPQNVELLAVLASGSTAAASAKAGQKYADDCVLNVQFTELSSDFTARRGEPVTIGVKVADCAGKPLTPGSGRSALVLVRFGNRDPDLSLTHVRDGEWRATWRPTNASTDRVTVSITAILIEGTDRKAGQATRAGRVLADSTAPLVPQGALLHAASYKVGGALAPGTLVALYGTNLTDTDSVNTFPLPFRIGGTEVRLAGKLLPLVATSASAGQINAQLPYDLPVDETLQIEVRRNNELSVPEPFVVAAAQPGVFTENQKGSGQGIIVKSDQVTLAKPDTPAERGEIIVIYGTGLGAVDSPVELGQPAPVPAAKTRNAVKVTIGGRPAEVLFSGLTPGYAGLYQVNARVPADAPAGDAVEVVLEVAGQTSAPVTMAVR